MYSPIDRSAAGQKGDDRQRAQTAWVLILLIVYTLVFLPSVFAQIEASDFMDIDPASIMDALDGLTSSSGFYDMNEQYHSKFYGWTYFALNTIIIAAIKAVGLGSEVVINLAARAILFVIGGLLVWRLFTLANMFFTGTWSAVATLVFMVNPVSAHYFVEIHPESLGLLCQVIAIQKLVELYRTPAFDKRKFFWAVVFLTLSALSKHFFFIVAFFIYVGFLLMCARCARIEPAMTWQQARNLTARGIRIFLAVSFVIHPYAFLDPIGFYEAQTGLAADHSTIDLGEALWLWVGTIAENPLISMNLLLLLVIPFLSARHFAFKLSVALTALTVVIFVFGARTWIVSLYFYPVHAIAVFNGFYFLIHVLLPAIKLRFGATPTQISTATFASALVTATTWNAAFAISTTHERLLLDGLTTSHAAWSWISRELPADSRIAYSPNVALLEPYKSQSCHPWRTCPDLASLQAFEPDYLLFSPDYPYFDAAEFTAFAERYSYLPSRTFVAEPIMARSECKPFSFQNALSAPKSPLKCVQAYREALAVRAEQRIVEGLDVVLYSKS